MRLRWLDEGIGRMLARSNRHGDGFEPEAPVGSEPPLRTCSSDYRSDQAAPGAQCGGL